MIVKYEDLSAEQKKQFDDTMREAEQKEVQYLRDRGFGPMEVAAAGFAYKAWYERDLRSQDHRPFDKAPGFRRMWILGYLTAKSEAPHE